MWLISGLHNYKQFTFNEVNLGIFKEKQWQLAVSSGSWQK
jgi:hypothetical protein